MSLKSLYHPTQDEASRQAFVGALKSYVNGPIEAQLEAVYENEIAPAFERTNGHKPANRAEAGPLLAENPLFQVWASILYTSQDLLWETSGETVDRVRTEMEAAAAALTNRADKHGSILLDPTLVLPSPIANVEIHRQPGGYFGEAHPGDITAPALYMGAVETYLAAKGLADTRKPGSPMIGRYVAAMVGKHAPDLHPTRVLDMGCGNGTQTMAFKQVWPEAEIHGLDISAPFIKFAHAWAEDHGTALHFRQADAAKTGYPDNHFDLIVSHILCHETWDDVLAGIVAESYRILKPGGFMLHFDVPYQPHAISITKQVTNHWQVAHNGEPFWTGFADTDVSTLLCQAGFAPEKIVTSYEPMGAGKMFTFGGWK